MAEALAKEIFGDQALVLSAGSQPKSVNPNAVTILSEVGIDIRNNHAKSIDQLDPAILSSLDFVITLCEEEVCPSLPSKSAELIQWPMPDPAAAEELSEPERLSRFRQTRELLTERILELSRRLGYKYSVKM
jgi:arsenate reductase